MKRLSVRFDFKAAAGHVLAGRLELLVGTPAATAVFAHCFTCSKDSFAAARIARAMVERGVAVLRFDFTGLGSSAGDFANTNFSSNVADPVSAARALGERVAPARLLIGHSLGGTAVLKAAAEVPEVAAVVTLGAPFQPGHVRHLLTTAESAPPGEEATPVSIGGRTFRISRGFLEDLDRHEMAGTVAGLGHPLLVMHDPADTIVEIGEAEKILDAAAQPKAFIPLPGAGHLISGRQDAGYVADLIAVWAQRILGTSADRPAAEQQPGALEGTVVVRETGEGRFAQIVTAGPHVLTADEPPSFVGTDTGPSPYQLLLASLGACTAMTIRLYAAHKGLALENVAVRLTHAKVHAEDCAACEAAPAKIDRIEREIVLDGALDDAQRARLLEIAEKCPVHRTLHGHPQIVTRLAPQAD